MPAFLRCVRRSAVSTPSPPSNDTTRPSPLVSPDSEAMIKAVSHLETFDHLKGDLHPELLKATVMLKLNGGLGTGMGLSEAKSLLPVKEGETFLDLIAKQVLHFRDTYKMPVRFMLMNSFSTSEDTKDFLSAKYPQLAAEYDSIELMQNKVPKLCAETHGPAKWDDEKGHEWCPPGHGDLYTALYGSGMLEQLLRDGYKYLFVSNSDNLGATLDLKILDEFANKGYDFLMEVCERTESDKKGGHLAADAKSGHLLLRESSQCPKEDEAAFQNVEKHKYFNTNNLWVNLESLKKQMDKHHGHLPLPVIKNKKTVHPSEPSSPAVIQIETAMGSAIQCFKKASAIVVPRSRFAPVKTCNDLLALRSDCYVVTPDHRVELVPQRHGKPPVVSLEDRFYKYVHQFDRLIPHGAPSMVECERLSIKGPVVFASGAKCKGTVSISNPKEERHVVEGTVSGEIHA